jgi:hypothetical protein
MNQIMRKINNIFYYIKILFFPYNHVKISTLGRGYTDKDNILLHSCFQIFCDFIEKEKPFERTSFDLTEEINNTVDVQFKQDLIERHEALQKERIELELLYRWWKVDRPEKAQQLEILLDAEIFDSNRYMILEDELIKEEQLMLHRLIDIRLSLWT